MVRQTYVIVAAVGLVQACASPEQKASTTAIDYALTGVLVEDVAKAWAMACPDEQAAKSLEEAKAERAALLAEYPDLAKAAEEERPAAYEAASVTIASGGTSATVELRDPSTPDAGVRTISLGQNQAGEWCVQTGWVEEARRKAERERLQKISDDAMATLDDFLTLYKDWKLDEAKLKLDEARALIESIPEDESVGAMARITLGTNQSLYDLKAEGWLGGRWRSSSKVDPMTDKVNAVARLESVDTMPDIIGKQDHATLLLRCQKGKFEVYISTPSMLDAHWRYDSVTGQYRIGKAPPSKLSGTRSSDYKAVFLRNPKEWAGKLKAADGENFIVELPVHDRLPQTVTFDLTGSTKAVDAALQGCS